MISRCWQKIAMRQAISHNHNAHGLKHNLTFIQHSEIIILFMERDPAANEHLCTFVLSIYSH